MKLKKMFGEGGIKGFFALHAEKLIFGVVILLVVFFVYSSATQEGISLSETPEKLKDEAQRPAAISRPTTGKRWKRNGSRKWRLSGSRERDPHGDPRRPICSRPAAAARDPTPATNRGAIPSCLHRSRSKLEGASTAWLGGWTNPTIPLRTTRTPSPNRKRLPSRRSPSETAARAAGRLRGEGDMYGMGSMMGSMGPGSDYMDEDYGIGDARQRLAPPPGHACAGSSQFLVPGTLQQRLPPHHGRWCGARVGGAEERRSGLGDGPGSLRETMG
jgi:hypothetical protein